MPSFIWHYSTRFVLYSIIPTDTLSVNSGQDGANARRVRPSGRWQSVHKEVPRGGVAFWYDRAKWDLPRQESRDRRRWPGFCWCVMIFFLFYFYFWISLRVTRISRIRRGIVVAVAMPPLCMERVVCDGPKGRRYLCCCALSASGWTPLSAHAVVAVTLRSH